LTEFGSIRARVAGQTDVSASSRKIVNACCSSGAHNVALVGGGAAGFEVLLGLAYRIRSKALGEATVRFDWITDTPEILPTFSPRVRAAALRILAQQQVVIHSGARVTRVLGDALELANGKRIDTQHTVWVTGAQPGAMFAKTGLHTDARGFISVDACLRSTSHPNVYASGDVASVAEHPRPKAGVFAVRQGPALTRNLRLALAERPPLPFVPQQHFLVILSAGSRYAIATKAGLAVEGRWVWTWKDWIDRRFMARFQPQP
jgi:selenide,water dikinase